MTTVNKSRVIKSTNNGYYNANYYSITAFKNTVVLPCVHHRLEHEVCYAASNSAILASNSATAGVLGAALFTALALLTSSVTHPSLAVATH